MGRYFGIRLKLWNDQIQGTQDTISLNLVVEDKEHANTQMEGHDGTTFLFLFAYKQMCKMYNKNTTTFANCKASVKEKLQCFRSVMLPVRTKKKQRKH